MKGIPVSFEYRGEQVQGILQAVSGGGAGIWHLMVNNFYYGRLRIANGEWVFDGNKRTTNMQCLAGILGAVVST